MDPRKYLPSNHSYAYYGSNSSFHFLHPGEYSIRMAMPSNILPGDQQQTFTTSTDITTNVHMTPQKRVSLAEACARSPIPGSPVSVQLLPQSPLGNASVKSEHSQSPARSVSAVEVSSKSASQMSTGNSGLVSGNDGLPFFGSPGGHSGHSRTQ